MHLHTESRLLSVENSSDGIVIRFFPPSVSLDDSNAPLLDELLTHFIDGGQEVHLIVELGNVENVSVLALGVFARLHSQVAARGGRLTLRDMRDTAYEAFEAMQLTRILDIRRQGRHERPRYQTEKWRTAVTRATICATLALAAVLSTATPVRAGFFFSTGNPDGKIATATRPDNGPGQFEIETGDDFVLTAGTLIDHATFQGLLVNSGLSDIGQVRVEIYRVFPADSDVDLGHFFDNEVIPGRFSFDFFEPLPIQMEVSDTPLTSDAGLLPLRQFDQRIGLTADQRYNPGPALTSVARLDVGTDDPAVCCQRRRPGDAGEKDAEGGGGFILSRCAACRVPPEWPPRCGLALSGCPLVPKGRPQVRVFATCTAGEGEENAD
jgi:anti-anti-sigma factor